MEHDATRERFQHHSRGTGAGAPGRVAPGHRTRKGERSVIDQDEETREVWPGRPFPLGPTWDGSGTNFALFSENAERVELCLFGDDGREERIEVTQVTAYNWHCYVPGAGPGTRYGYRVHGPWDPARGHRFNPAKLCIDPYAKAIDGGVSWDLANTLGYEPGGDADGPPSDEDSADAIPKCVVVDSGFDWEDDAPPQIPWHETSIYELHVKGFTMRRADLPHELRGTYAGLASDQAISHLKALGVTAVELLPVHHFIDEHALAERGLSNYWGYSSIGFLAPHAAYSASGTRGEQVREFKGMVKALHRAGIEVILDVVYNHTAEGDHRGPMLAFRGIDNASYYRLMPDDPSRYMDYTGTGNSLNPVHPSVLRLIMDSLRYWVREMHVDGFRFDLASALAREFYDVDRLSSFFDVIHQDPVLSQVKLIAEPWDVGPGGYQVGNFPVLWTEWNGVYRDSMRDFWRGSTHGVSDLATRLTGSADLYQGDGRHPVASINFVTAHDGFTLNDLVSYNDKHNEANGEDNRDGTDDNRSWNHGAEGPTDDQAILNLRERQKRNFLATLFLCQGVPMLVAGDEMGRTQGGNNNGYCQDNEISWIDWGLDEPGERLLTFTQRVIRLRNENPVFRRQAFFTGEPGARSGLRDLWWFRRDGRQMANADWARGDLRALGMFLNGDEIPTPTPRGERLVGDSFLLLVNAGGEDEVFTLPPRRFGLRWSLSLSTAEPEAGEGSRVYAARASAVLRSRSLLLLRRAR